MKVTVKLYNGRKIVRRWMTQDKTKWRKLYAKLASAGRQTRYFIRVSDENGMKNEYDGDNLQEAKKALSAFLE